MRYTVIVEKGRESGYVAYCPTLKGCVSQGPTREAALANLEEAMTVYIECLVEDGFPVPIEESKEFVSLEVSPA